MFKTKQNEVKAVVKKNTAKETIIKTGDESSTTRLDGFQRLRECCLILVFLSAILLAVALYSFNPADPAWSQTAWGDQVGNAGGRVGAWLADTLFSAFGLLAYPLPLLMILAGWLCFKPYQPKDKQDLMLLATRLLGGVLLILTSCGLADINFDDIWYFSSGGIIGDVLTELSITTLNMLGATLVFLFLWGAGITLLTGISWLTIAEKLGSIGIYVFTWLIGSIRGDKKEQLTPNLTSPLFEQPQVEKSALQPNSYALEPSSLKASPLEPKLGDESAVTSSHLEPFISSLSITPLQPESDPLFSATKHESPVDNLTDNEQKKSQQSDSLEPHLVSPLKRHFNIHLPESNSIHFVEHNKEKVKPAQVSSFEQERLAAEADEVEIAEDEIRMIEALMEEPDSATITAGIGAITQETVNIDHPLMSEPFPELQAIGDITMNIDDMMSRDTTMNEYSLPMTATIEELEQTAHNQADFAYQEESESVNNTHELHDIDEQQKEGLSAATTIAATIAATTAIATAKVASTSTAAAAAMVDSQLQIGTNTVDDEHIIEAQTDHNNREQDSSERNDSTNIDSDADITAFKNMISQAQASQPHLAVMQNPFLMQKSQDLPTPTTPMPTLDLLYHPEKRENFIDRDALEETARLLEEKLADYKITANVVDIFPGPVITRFELDLAPGVKVSRISSLSMDLARSLSAMAVRVVEVIPGKPYVGLELPNMSRQTVYLSDVVASPQFQEATSPTTVVLGQDIAGEALIADLAKMPHVLVAGTTGSGKSVGVNVMILSILYKATPEDVRFIMIDPKMLELSIYEGIPHLLSEVVTDMKDASNALRWCVGEMERRYKLMSIMGVRNIKGFNDKLKMAAAAGHPIHDPLWQEGDTMDPYAPLLEKLPYIVVIVDEFADLIMVVGKKVEELIARLAQKARAAGIHLVLATQRPSVDVITGIIKANIPTRIAFTVGSKIDSRTILDQGGAESLLGMGDMLYLPPGSSHTIRVHGAFASDDDVHAVVNDWKARGKPNYIEEITAGEQTADNLLPGETLEGEEEMDPLFDQVVEYIVESRRGSVSGVQRRFKIGYNRAARIVDQLEAQGIVSAPGHNGNREVLAPPPVKERL